jgi:predicted HD superfamily hydrolase involved in NAD metabolism
MPNLRLPALDARWEALSAHRKAHSTRVADLCRALADVHGQDAAVLYLAGLYHDVAREMPREVLLQEARRLAWPVDGWEEKEPLLLHGPVAGVWAREAGLAEPGVDAIFWHTTAHPGLSPAGRILFIADGVEPGRGDYPGRRALYDLTFRDLDGAYRGTLQSTLRYLEGRDLVPHPRMMAAIRMLDPPLDVG